VSTEQLPLDGAPGRRILRLYNLYRVIIGLALVLLISSDLYDQLLELAHAQLFRYGSWTYLILNVLVAVLLQRPSHLGPGLQPGTARRATAVYPVLRRRRHPERHR